METVQIKYDYSDDYNPEKAAPSSIDARVLSWIKKGSRVLELGCSSGYMGKVLWGKGCNVTGVELNPIAAEKRTRFYENMIVGDIEDPNTLNVIQGYFDVIMCISVLEHLKNPLNVLKRLPVFLKQEGYFLIALPNIAHWSIRWHILRGRFDYEDYGILDETHLRFYTFHTAKKMIREVGLDVTDVYFERPDPTLFRCLKRHFPKIADKILEKFFYKFPNLFGYQFLFKAIPN